MTATQGGRRALWRRPATALMAALGVAAIVVIVAVATAPASKTPAGAPRLTQLQTNPTLDPGTALSGRAPGFTLTDQFGRQVSLRSERGHVVVLSFEDPQCTTVCPLTTASMVEAKAMLGAAGSSVQLLGVGANPKATAVRWVRAYSQAHGMMNEWHFLTGSLRQLRAVWRAYHIEVQIQAGQIDHTPALFVIDSQGHYAKLYVTQMAYSSVGQQAQVLAHELSSLLPGRPRPHSSLSYAQIAPVGPGTAAVLPKAGGGTVAIGPRSGAHLYLFFATWLTETSNLAGELESLRRYRTEAAAHGLPPLTAVDEGSVEPSPRTLGAFLRGLPAPLTYPVAIDRTGRVADGYLVQDQPWFVLVSRSGQIDWYRDATTQGWPTLATLERYVREGLANPPRVRPPNVHQLIRELAGSPPVLAALHRQASRLLGSDKALVARLRELRGYPVVVNAWASWCDACMAEYPLFASASVRYGRQVAFVGADTEDLSPTSARSYLASHPLSYPSYRAGYGEIVPTAQVIDLPTTIYINRAGKVTYVETGQYDSQGVLDGDIQEYALNG